MERRARVVFLIRIAPGGEEDFLAAYERIRHQVAGGVPGHLGDQVCRSTTDPGQWMITSEWRDLRCFEEWEASAAHRELVAPMRACMTDARSLRFAVVAETAAESAA
ncbi:antibiotic biosynthesis monooxygenase family protein [Streptomyces alkaliterrae]|uniref:Antibiotic biosynthesis monooxygenase n=1 Tax=Streptomyces alkaliterrae TaxID=2213162 RepID=A0A5P0YQ89_9ACTN|nr:antibiotic biosynthesis monooxygenase family protein [Streptomyces alkaliterrae]MBB1253384.1 antibiotic biosynthesis monooxygenase [Streptomyces alkaliterrae]MBB1259178.1 antibiotic biosynthesis monooxygenase [Streptomyces alkaliterrae]MQS01592.1 antibiotic biosynthesis monooxygenase [Streptomyces alkaliterrae]